MPQDFNQLLKPDRFQVFLFASPIPVPFHFAVHAWFVINRMGEVHRWEFGKFRNSPHPGGIGILKDFLAPTDGMNRYPWKSKPRHDAYLLDFVEGDKKSVAAAMTSFIHAQSGSYPYRNRYSYLGPNSNTYVQWVLNHYPESGLKLPHKAIGKSYSLQEV